MTSPPAVGTTAGQPHEEMSRHSALPPANDERRAAAHPACPGSRPRQRNGLRLVLLTPGSRDLYGHSREEAARDMAGVLCLDAGRASKSPGWPKSPVNIGSPLSGSCCSPTTGDLRQVGSWAYAVGASISTHCRRSIPRCRSRAPKESRRTRNPRSCFSGRRCSAAPDRTAQPIRHLPAAPRLSGTNWSC
jgi:hypothetical protein